jgi:hypothetical protein
LRLPTATGWDMNQVGMWEIFKEFLQFLVQEKKWWLVPLVILLLALGAFLVFSASSPLAPFLYPLF